MNNLEIRIEDLSGDMLASFKQLSTYLGTFEDRFDTVEKDITNIKGDISDIRATMATKDDIATMQGNIVAMQGDIRTIKAGMATKDDIVNIQQSILLLVTQMLE
ncbi:MAG: hypothetical protein ABI456_06750, partial [Ktedonobacteraceae bacterium]